MLLEKKQKEIQKEVDELKASVSKEVKEMKTSVAVGSGLLVGFLAGSISTAIVFTIFKGLAK